MTAINGLGPTPPAGRTARPAAATAGFNLDGADAPREAAAPIAAAELSLAGLLALQADESGEVRDRTARRHGRSLLEALAALQRAILSGIPAPDLLHHLAGLAGEVPSAADPRLGAALDDIVLRARVELARLEPAAGDAA